MKVRIKIPGDLNGTDEKRQIFVDDVLLWGMETGMDIDFYAYFTEPNSTWNNRKVWAVFTIENDYSFMFSLRWGALLHKKQKQLAV